MALVFKHEALLTFVGRLVRDREFSEWFAARPTQALASHGLQPRDMKDMADVLMNDRNRPKLATALLPTVNLFLDFIEKEPIASTEQDVAGRVAMLDGELRSTHERLQLARTASRSWWKFWEWDW